jgi:predicted dithiol-disulfide oxidoreductase (DUF899 family)
MVKFENYTFTTKDGSTTLLDLFGDKVQLAVYQFMDNGPDAFCPGCTWFTNNIAHLNGLAEAGVAWANVSNMPIAQIEAYKAKMGWTMPFVSSRGTSFGEDCGTEGYFGLSMFFRDGTDVYQTYFTKARGVDRLLFVNNILDLAPYGRQQDWEDSPADWPQDPTYG